MNITKLNLIFWPAIIFIIAGLYFAFHEHDYAGRSPDETTEILSGIATRIDEISQDISILNAKVDGLQQTPSRDYESISGYEYKHHKQEAEVAEVADVQDAHASESAREDNESDKLAVYERLNDPMLSITDLMELEEYNRLPDEIRNEVMEEVVRRFNNGEVDKYSFLPGYKELP